jgi:hypothetical protein
METEIIMLSNVRQTHVKYWFFKKRQKRGTAWEEEEDAGRETEEGNGGWSKYILYVYENVIMKPIILCY